MPNPMPQETLGELLRRKINESKEESMPEFTPATVYLRNDLKAGEYMESRKIDAVKLMTEIKWTVSEEDPEVMTASLYGAVVLQYSPFGHDIYLAHRGHINRLESIDQAYAYILATYW